MNARTAISAAIVGFASLGCSTFISGPMRPCSSQVCFVKVTVSGDCANAKNIVVIPPTIPLGRGNNDPAIHWDIETSNYTFAPIPNGIVITSPTPPAGEFHDPTLASNGTKYILKDKNSSTQTYKYTVNLMHRGNACAPKDPFIANGQ